LSESMSYSTADRKLTPGTLPEIRKTMWFANSFRSTVFIRLIEST
jgi:hypothetical protein